jgi:hypothetical protein
MHEFKLQDWTLVVVTVAGIDAVVNPLAFDPTSSIERIRSQWLASFEVRNTVNAVDVLEETNLETLDCFPLVFTGTFCFSKLSN